MTSLSFQLVQKHKTAEMKTDIVNLQEHGIYPFIVNLVIQELNLS